VVAEAILFLPLMAVALRLDPSGSIPLKAGVITAVVFGGLTAMVFLTGADFSWLGRYLFLAGLVALGFVLVAAFTAQINLGLIFSAFIVLLAAGYILYDTSNVMYHYDSHQHVAAALALFASVALMLWYVIRILIAMQRD
jgi:FtsH-binding integral membrane protein